MKKVMNVAALVLMLAMLSGCLNDAEKKIVGKYVVDVAATKAALVASIGKAKPEMPTTMLDTVAQEMAAAFGRSEIEFTSSKRVKMKLDGKDYQSKWVVNADGTLTITDPDGTTSSATVQGDTLILHMASKGEMASLGDLAMVLKKQ